MRKIDNEIERSERSESIRCKFAKHQNRANIGNNRVSIKCESIDNAEQSVRPAKQKQQPNRVVSFKNIKLRYARRDTLTSNKDVEEDDKLPVTKTLAADFTKTTIEKKTQTTKTAMGKSKRSSFQRIRLPSESISKDNLARRVKSTILAIHPIDYRSSWRRGLKTSRRKRRVCRRKRA